MMEGELERTMMEALLMPIALELACGSRVEEILELAELESCRVYAAN